MKAFVSPFETPSLLEVFQDNLIGGNAGNLLFIQSISRAVLRDNTDIDYITTNRSFDEE